MEQQKTIKEYSDGTGHSVDDIRTVIKLFGISSTGLGEKGKAPTPPKTYSPLTLDEAFKVILAFKAKNPQA